MTHRKLHSQTLIFPAAVGKHNNFVSTDRLGSTGGSNWFFFMEFSSDFSATAYISIIDIAYSKPLCSSQKFQQRKSLDMIRLCYLFSKHFTHSAFYQTCPSLSNLLFPVVQEQKKIKFEHEFHQRPSTIHVSLKQQYLFFEQVLVETWFEQGRTDESVHKNVQIIPLKKCRFISSTSIVCFKGAYW